MLNTIKRLMIVSVLMLVGGAAHADAMQIYYCNQHEDASDEQVDDIASQWYKAARTMKGGENLQMWLRFPIAAQAGPTDFVMVLVAPTFEEWGEFTDAYEGSPAEEVDDNFEEIADCTRTTIWESHQVQ